MSIAVHITHESVKKIGGIGAVLSGVCTDGEYKSCYDKTVFYGPLFELSSDAFSHLGKSGELLFSSHDHFDSGNYSETFGEIISKYNVDIFYAERELVSEFDISRRSKVDVINVGINRMNHDEVEKFKYTLWKEFGIESHLYADDWDYEQYLRIAIPYLEILTKLYGPDCEFCHFAHEYMGVPAGLAVLLAGRKEPTVFVAHEVTTARSIVENIPGHDISFYNILEKARSRKSLEQVFGSQKHNCRSELVKRAVKFDHIFAVGDRVKAEYNFLVPEVTADKIKIVYNGISAKTAQFEHKQQARAHIEEYTERLFNFRPDTIFTHVTRLVMSKGIWRDIELLNFLDRIFVERGLKGVYILLSTQIATGRPPEDIFKMERDYGWPVLHNEGWPDLIGMEVDTYRQLQVFNAKSKAIKGVLLNQFGFDRARCGARVPADAEFDDLRMASDVELGLSIYEPFGIAQIETIAFGGVAVMSSSCGAAQFLCDRFDDAPIKPFYILDYISAGKKLSYNALKNLTIQQRSAMESKILSTHAGRIFEVLPLSSEKRQQYLANAQEYISKISWSASAKDYVLSTSLST